MAKDLNNILLSAIEENKIKEKTPDKLPLNPTAEGWSGHEVRRFLAKSLIDSEGSFLAEFKKKMTEIKALFEDVFGDGDGNIQGQIDSIIQDIAAIDENGVSTLARIVSDNYNTLDNIKVNKTLTILGIDLQDNITLAEFKTALGDATTFANGLMSALDKENLAETMIDIQSLFSDKVPKTTTILGLDLQDNILLGEFRIALGNATQNVAGLLSAEDKTHLDGLVALLETDDENNVVDTIGEILAIFEEYPEGADLVSALQGKVDKVEGKGLSTNDFTDDYKDKVDNQLTIEDFPTTMTPTAHTHTISEITDFPASIAPAEHNHDDRYYTETEVDKKLAGKQDKLVAGANITIDENTNEISASGSGSYDDLTDKPDIPTKVSDLTNDTGYITGYTETDPIFTAWNKSTGISITESQISDLQSYLTTETDPIFTAWNKSTGISITKSQVNDLIEATQELSGLMSATDKQRLDVLHALLEEDEENNVVDSINEVLAIFNNYPEGADLVTALAGKVDKVTGKGLSTNDFTTAEKTKLSGIAEKAQVNVLEGIQLNGTDVAISGKKSNIVVNKTTVDLGNVKDVDTTNPANITQSATYRFVSDNEKSTWSGKQNKLTAGEGISIVDNVISSTDAGNVVTLVDAQTISGAKTFSSQVKITHPGHNPGLLLESDAYVIDASGSMMADMIKGRVTNDNGKTATMFVIGTYGVEDFGDIPRPHYMYLDSRMDGNYDTATLKVDVENRVGVALGRARPIEALDVGGKIRMRTQTVAGDNDNIVVTKGYMDAAINTLNHDIVLIADTAFTITQAHFNKTLIITSSDDVTITVPTKIVEDIEKGFFCDIIRYGTGKVVFSGAGIVLNSAGPLSIDAQYIAASLIKIDDNNEWLLIGGRE